MRILATMMTNAQCSLAILDLRANELGDIGARILAEALCQNKSLTKAVLWRNRIRTRGLFCLAQALVCKWSVLLARNSAFAGHEGSATDAALRFNQRHNSTLTTLDVSYNDCAGPEAVWWTLA
jgi:Ran GTPase-activating protein (RanGAP) involved in mRNA processing and transport